MLDLNTDLSNTKFSILRGNHIIRTSDIRKLSDFRQNATAHLDRLAQSDGVEILTVNGEAKGVVMAPHLFDEMLDCIEQETAASI